MKWVKPVEEWRFATDITDSLSQGGRIERACSMWDVGFGETKSSLGMSFYGARIGSPAHVRFRPIRIFRPIGALPA